MSFQQAERRDGKRENSLSLLVKYCSAGDSKFTDPERESISNFMANENSSVKEGDDECFVSK